GLRASDTPRRQAGASRQAPRAVDGVRRAVPGRRPASAIPLVVSHRVVGRVVQAPIVADVARTEAAPVGVLGLTRQGAGAAVDRRPAGLHQAAADRPIVVSLMLRQLVKPTGLLVVLVQSGVACAADGPDRRVAARWL